MPLEEDTIQLTSILADALRQAIAQATQLSISAISQPSQSDYNAAASTSNYKAPSFNAKEFKDSDGVSVASYFERFELALQLSRIPEEDYLTYSRVHMGSQLNEAFKYLIHPKKPEAFSYNEMKMILIKHYDKKPNKYAESVKFRKIIQHEDESLADFALRLRHGALHCEYGEFIDRMLIEQLIFGMNSRMFCEEIISKNPNTFEEAYEIAHVLEATQQTASSVKTLPTHQSEQMNKLGYNPIKNKKRYQQRNINENQSKSSSSESTTTNTSSGLCHGCGGNHQRRVCKFRESTCFVCGRKGHLSRVCKSRTNHIAEEDSNDSDPEFQTNIVNVVKCAEAVKKTICVSINGTKIEMEIDTGAPCGIISKNHLKNIKHSGIFKTTRKFHSYSGHSIPCLGRIPVYVKVGETIRKLNLYVMDGDYDPLFGREWISHFVKEINWSDLFSPSNQVNSIKTAQPLLCSSEERKLQYVLSQYNDIFSETAGKLVGQPAKVHLKSDVTPRFAKAREIPLALRDAYAAEIDAKIASGFYVKVDYSEWASPTHVVVKKNGKLRITGNYKPTLNPLMIIDEHPIPKAEMLLNKMNDSKLFCHLDITDAYSHLTVDEEYAHALTLNTPTHGLIRPTRAVYGAANIPAIWQRRMEEVLLGLENVCSFFDDILIYASDFEQLLIALRNTLERLKQHGLRLNRSKCIFAAPAVEFLGHKIDARGIHKSDAHIEAIRDAPMPSTIDELQLFLGKACYYSSFINNFSSRSYALRQILKTEPLQWTSESKAAYEDIKNSLISSEVLIPYNPNLPLLLATDASKVGIGAVLSHRLENGLERPIAYASRTLTKTEQKYPQMDREALAIVWAVQKFFLYLYARHWTLITDHKPLSQILHPHKTLPILCISRMANYADFLANFDFDVIFKPTKQNANADFCSRAVKLNSINSLTITKDIWIHDDFDLFIVNQIKQLPVSSKRIVKETLAENELGKIVKHLEMGKDLLKLGYKSPEVNYKLMNGCLLFEHRVVIPKTLRQRILEDLHAGHLGMVKMKGIARSFVYWPGIDGDIEIVANECENCGRMAHNPPRFKDHHWIYPTGPWERVHVDFAGPVAGSMLLIISDAYSKWLEVKITNSTTSHATIAILDEVFAAYGAPVTLVSDNGSNFTSKDFNDFLHQVGVRYHKLTAPYHPSTNGQAERAVQTVKNALKAMNTTRSTIQENMNEFLRQYRLAPHNTTGQSPAQLFLGRLPRSRLNLVFPQDISQEINERNFYKGNVNSNYRSFNTGQTVWFLSNNNTMDKWVKGVVKRKLGDIHYEIEREGKIFKRHIDQIKKRTQNELEEKRELRIERDGWRPKTYVTNASSATVGTELTMTERAYSESSSNTGSPDSMQRSHKHPHQSIETPTPIYTSTDSSSELQTGSATTAVTATPIQPSKDVPCVAPKNPKINKPLRRSTRVRKERLVFSP